MIRVLPPSRHQLATLSTHVFIWMQLMGLRLFVPSLKFYPFAFLTSWFIFVSNHFFWCSINHGLSKLIANICFPSAYNITLQDTLCTKAESVPPLASLFLYSIHCFFLHCFFLMSAIQTTQLFSQQFVHVHHVKLYIPLKKNVMSILWSNVCHFKSLTCFRFYLTLLFFFILPSAMLDHHCPPLPKTFTEFSQNYCNFFSSYIEKNFSQCFNSLC